MSAINLPSGAKHVADFPGDSSYALYYLPQKAEEANQLLWLRMLFQRPPGTPKKWGGQQKFRVSWNPDQQRLARCGDANKLGRDWPDAFLWLNKALAKAFTFDFIFDENGLGLTQEDYELQCRFTADSANLRAEKQLAERQRKADTLRSLRACVALTGWSPEKQAEKVAKELNWWGLLSVAEREYHTQRAVDKFRKPTAIEGLLS